MKQSPNYKLLIMAAFAVCAALAMGSTHAAKIADIRGTKHNFSAAPAGTPTPTGEVLERGTPNTGAVRPDGSLVGGGASADVVQDTLHKTEAATQICVFCHTPHGATNNASPLWNRTLSSATYLPYTSASLDSQVIRGAPLEQPGGSSKLCLSCHDGTLAIGNVNVANGISQENGVPGQNIALNIDGARKTNNSLIREGAGATTGFTRRLGIDLTNDHPISIDFTAALAARDGELRPVTADANQRWPNTATPVVGVRTASSRPKLKLEVPAGGGAAQVQCATCHDPHLRESDPAVGNQKFLRLNRFQEAAPQPEFNATNDIICLACHDRNQEGQVNSAGPWSFSSHANAQSAISTYVTTGVAAPAVALREFPTAQPIWKAACLNCHDTHTVQGSRRLLREGVDALAPVGTPKTAGNAALEEACYACHTTAAASVVTSATRPPPDIKTDFTTLNRRMPITTPVQGLGGNTTEVHEISGQPLLTAPNCDGPTNKCGADFIEQQANLGLGNLNNRHAECTDCHNPHRVVPFRNFLGKPPGTLTGLPDAAGTHPHYDSANVPAGEYRAGAPFKHSNIASGPLRGTYGVEPIYSSATFGTAGIPDPFVVKRGDPGSSTSDLVTEPYVTREYQICLKCHSNYGFSDNDLPDVAGNRPNLRVGAGQGTTPAGANALTQYTNIAKEIQAPATHKGNLVPGDSGAFAGTPPLPTGVATYVVNFQANNRRGWHPVMAETGRIPALRSGTINGQLTPTIWNLPWSNFIGEQTMYCTDCHGSGTPAGTAIPVGGDLGNPWGPHGSNHNFLLKGPYDRCTGTTNGLNGTLANCLADTGGAGGLNGGPINNTAIYPDGAVRSQTLGTTEGDLCFKCHDYVNYATPNGNKVSGFSGSKHPNLHVFHADKVGSMRCTWCHAAVPHGFKNKVLLVNLNDVGPEALCRDEEVADGVNCTPGLPMRAGTQVRTGGAGSPNPTVANPAITGGPANYWQRRGYTNPPYYLNARVKINTFASSGQWEQDACGPAGAPGDLAQGRGRGWMRDSNESCGGSL